MNAEPEDTLLKGFLTELNPMVHEPVRLGILTLLLFHKKLAFSTIQRVLGISSGNLNSHAKKLSENGYIIISKKFVDAKPRTIIELSNEGKLALQNYAKRVTEVIDVIEEQK